MFLVAHHRECLKHFGFWEDFQRFARESADLNPACLKYKKYEDYPIHGDYVRTK
jgi:hypothetical protein